MFAPGFLLFAAVAAAPNVPAPEPSRVAQARHDKGTAVQQLFADARVAYPPREVLLRSFKSEGRLELWAGNGSSALALIKSYPVCASSGSLGPKRREGDLQVPEGFYDVDALNPWSSFHLALHVDYPNAADRIRSQGVRRLGGAIMVHGNCVTIGCIPIEDDPIKEVYLIVHDARARGARIPIHIFPRRLHDEALAELLKTNAPADTKALWRELAAGSAAFEGTKRIPRLTIDRDGRYRVTKWRP